MSSFSQTMEVALKESERRYRSLFQNTQDAIFMTAADGKIIDFNQAWLELFGYTKKEILKLDARELYANPTDRDDFQKKLERQGFVRDFETKARRKDGTLRDCLLTAVAWQNEEGHILGYQGITRDITERKRAENELRLSEERFRKVFYSSPIATLITSFAGPIVDVNDAWLRMTGFTREEVVGRSTTELGMVPEPDQRGRLAKELLEKRGLSNVEIFRLTKSGELRNILNTLELVELSGQECILNMQVDITERKKMEEEIRGLSQYLELIIENANVWLNVLDRNGNVTVWNRAAEEISGYPRGEVIGHKGVWDSLYPDEKYREQVMKRVREIIDKGVTAERETTIRRRDGEVRVMSWRSRGLHDENGNSIGYVSLGLDITESKKAEEALQLSEAKYRTLVENATDLIFLIGKKDEVMSINPAATRLLGKTVSQVLGKSLYDVYPKEIATMFSENVRAVLQTGEKKTIDEKIVFAGKELWINTRLEPMLDDRGRAYAVTGVARDITERKRMEEELERYSKHLEELVQARTAELKVSEEKYRHIYNASLGCIYRTSLDGNILEMNPAGVAMLGYDSLDELKKINFRNVYANPADREEFIRVAEVGPVRNFEKQLKRKDGKLIDIIENSYTIRNAKGKIVGFQGTIVDITQLKLYQKRLLESEARSREAERLSAIGKTAMMIGHDLRNPLQVVVNALYLIRDTLESLQALYPDSEEMRESTTVLDRVDRQIEYMNKIVSDLQDYARPLRPELTETGLDQLIIETLSTIKIPENIEVSNDITKDVRVIVDPAMMKRVFTNLITNAIQAMPNGGKLTIRASRIEDNILVSIKDTGTGIAKENITKLFTPLFTTKAKGQGFGLSVCKRIIEAHKGDITVESEEGKGATFTVKLPLEEVN